MKLTRPTALIGAFSRLELVICMALGIVLALMILTPILKMRVGGARVNCVYNLKQVGLSFRIWASDHNDLFPMGTSTNQGGTMEYTGPNEVFRHFQVMSNELSSPKILLCPRDTKTAATSFTMLSDLNISYFIGLDSNETNPVSVLSGDWNLSSNGLPVKTWLLRITTNSLLGWTSNTLHSSTAGQPIGNIALGDGSVQQVTSDGLAELIRISGGPNRLLMP